MDHALNEVTHPLSGCDVGHSVLSPRSWDYISKQVFRQALEIVRRLPVAFAHLNEVEEVPADYVEQAGRHSDFSLHEAEERVLDGRLSSCKEL